MTEERWEEILQHARKVSRELASLSAYERLMRTLRNWRRIDPNGELPKAFVLNRFMFAKWFYWCKENDHDYKELWGVQIVLRREAPFKVAVRYQKE